MEKRTSVTKSWHSGKKINARKKFYPLVEKKSMSILGTDDQHLYSFESLCLFSSIHLSEPRFGQCSRQLLPDNSRKRENPIKNISGFSIEWVRNSITY